MVVRTEQSRQSIKSRTKSSIDAGEPSVLFMLDIHVLLRERLGNEGKEGHLEPITWYQSGR